MSKKQTKMRKKARNGNERLRQLSQHNSSKVQIQYKYLLRVAFDSIREAVIDNVLNSGWTVPVTQKSN